MFLQSTNRVVTTKLPSSLHAWERLWPSFAPLRAKLLSIPNNDLPEIIQNTLLAMEDNSSSEEDDNSGDTTTTTTTRRSHGGFDHNDELNRRRVGVMTRRLNTFLECQLNQQNVNGSESVYTPETLDFYDMLVWDFNSPFHWRIHPQEIELLYKQGLSGSRRHREVAVGTGLFLRQWANYCTHTNDDNKDKENAPPPLDHGNAARNLEHLTLMDLSQSSLEGCYQRLKQVPFFENVEMDNVQANIMKDPSPSLAGSFDSVAANFLLHGLHGESMHDKRQAIQSCASLLRPNGVFFGSTILGKDLEADATTAGPHAIRTHDLYNELGIFGNRGDTYSDTQIILMDFFHDVFIVKVGYCAVWLARGPKLLQPKQ